MTDTMKVNPRSIILDALLEINEKNEYTHRIMREVLRKYQYLPARDRSFISRVTLGTVERKLTLDYLIDRVSKTPVCRMKPVIRNILRMGAYQLVYMDGTEDYAVCNEAVKLAAKRGFAGLKGFVNGVLRNLARTYRDISYPDLSIKYSTPRWLVEYWTAQYGAEKTEEFLAAQYTDQPLWIRVNTAKTTPEALAAGLSARGITVERDEEIPEAMTMRGYDYLEAIPEWNEGMFFVQDYASMLVTHRAGVREGMTVIDVCAAPGGKCTHVAQKLQGTGLVIARDVSEAKVALIEENIERLGLDNIHTAVQDATVLTPEMLGKADLVLADLPCSGLGILNKKPDIKYHANPARCGELRELQRRILNTVSQYVKPGGTLMYSTCTIVREENEENAAWIAEKLGFTLLMQEQLLPGMNHSYDGFFMAALRKNE